MQLLRIAVFLALGATLGALSGEAYVIAANREHATFVGEFQGAVAEMEQVVTAGFGAKVEAAVAMATLSAAAGAVAPGGGLPNASVPGFYAFAAPIVAVSGARAVSWNPVVTAQSLAGWNAFAAANAATAAGAFAALPASTPMVTINTLGLWQKNASGSKVPVTPRAFYTPVWQIAPMNNRRGFYTAAAALPPRLPPPDRPPPSPPRCATRDRAATRTRTRSTTTCTRSRRGTRR